MWTLALILCITAFVVAKTIESFVRKIKPTVYPSESVIDQILPPEVLEQVFVNVDYETLIKCSRVNKYWRYLASEKQLQNQVCANEKNWRIEPHDLLENFIGHRRTLDLNTLQWLDYPDSYNLEWKIQDQLLARKHGKKLVDVSLGTAMHLLQALDVPLKIDTDPPKDKWLVKFRAKPATYTSEEWRLKTIGEDPVFITIDRSAIPKHIPFKSNVDYELIIDLNAANKFSLKLTKVYLIRYINETSPWLDNSLFQVGTALFVPCLLVDFWQLNPVTKYWVKLVFALLIAGVPGAITCLVTFERFNKRTVPSWRRRYLVALAAVILLTVLFFWRWSLEMAFFVGCFYLAFIYVLTINDLFAKNYQYATYIAAMAVMLVALLTIDYRLLTATIRSRQIFATFGYNVLLHVLCGALIVVMLGINESLSNRRSFIWNMTNWNKNMAQGWIFFGLMTDIYVTLCAPETTSKVS